MALSKFVELGLMVGMDAGQAAVVRIEAGHLRQGIPQPIAGPRAFCVGPVDTAKLAESSTPIPRCLHIRLGSQEAGKLELIANPPAHLEPEYHLGVLSLAPPG